MSDCQEKRHSNPIANRVRRERQRLPTCLLIENASGPARLPGNFCAEAFPIKASDYWEVELRTTTGRVSWLLGDAAELGSVNALGGKVVMEISSKPTSGQRLIGKQRGRCRLGGHALSPGFEDHQRCSDRFGKFSTITDYSTSCEDWFVMRCDPL